MDAYGDFAEIYDRLMHDDIDYDAWCGYIEDIAAAFGCDGKNVCELACGTGNITSRLESRGYMMTGADISGDMIERAEKKTKHARYFRENMARFCMDEKFDMCLCMIDGLNYVIAPALAERTFCNVRHMLKDGGAFIFDISTRHKLRDIIGDETFIHSEYDVFYSWQNRYIEKYDISDMLLNFFVMRGDGRYDRFEERHLQRGYSEHEIRYMLNKAGFDNINVFGELSFEKPDKDAERIVFVCR